MHPVFCVVPLCSSFSDPQCRKKANGCSLDASNHLPLSLPQSSLLSTISNSLSVHVISCPAAARKREKEREEEEKKEAGPWWANMAGYSVVSIFHCTFIPCSLYAGFYHAKLL